MIILDSGLLFGTPCVIPVRRRRLLSIRHKVRCVKTVMTVQFSECNYKFTLTCMQCSFFSLPNRREHGNSSRRNR